MATAKALVDIYCKYLVMEGVEAEVQAMAEEMVKFMNKQEGKGKGKTEGTKVQTLWQAFTSCMSNEENVEKLNGHEIEVTRNFSDGSKSKLKFEAHKELKKALPEGRKTTVGALYELFNKHMKDDNMMTYAGMVWGLITDENRMSVVRELKPEWEATNGKETGEKKNYLSKDGSQVMWVYWGKVLEAVNDEARALEVTVQAPTTDAAKEAAAKYTLPFNEGDSVTFGEILDWVNKLPKGKRTSMSWNLLGPAEKKSIHDLCVL
jgi:hypothetical protein